MKTEDSELLRKFTDIQARAKAVGLDVSVGSGGVDLYAPMVGGALSSTSLLTCPSLDEALGFLKGFEYLRRQYVSERDGGDKK